MNKNAKRGRPLPDVPDLPKCLLLHAFFVGLDHLFDHLAADGARLAGGEVAVIALLEVDADLVGNFVLHFVQVLFRLGAGVDIVVAGVVMSVVFQSFKCQFTGFGLVLLDAVLGEANHSAHHLATDRPVLALLSGCLYRPFDS